MAQLSSDIEKQPQGGGVNKPASGTYGERADVEKLRQQLPSTGRPGGAPVQPGPPPMPAPGPGVVPQPTGRPLKGPAGVPQALLQPSTTSTPVNTPLARIGESGVVSTQGGIQARLALLEQLSASPDVSQATREWAKLLLEMLAGVA